MKYYLFKNKSNCAVFKETVDGPRLYWRDGYGFYPSSGLSPFSATEVFHAWCSSMKYTTTEDEKKVKDFIFIGSI